MPLNKFLKAIITIFILPLFLMMWRFITLNGLNCWENSWLHACGLNQPSLFDFVMLQKESNSVILGSDLGKIGWYNRTGRLIKEISLPDIAFLVGFNPYTGLLSYILKKEKRLCSLNIDEERTSCVLWDGYIEKPHMLWLQTFPNRAFIISPANATIYEIDSNLKITNVYRRSSLPGKYILFADEQQVIMIKDDDVFILDKDFRFIEKISLSLIYQRLENIISRKIEKEPIVFAGPNLLRVLFIDCKPKFTPFQVLDSWIGNIMEYSLDTSGCTSYLATYELSKNSPLLSGLNRIPIIPAKIGWIKDYINSAGIFYGDCKFNIYAARLSYADGTKDVLRITNNAKIRIPDGL